MNIMINSDLVGDGAFNFQLAPTFGSLLFHF